MHLRAPSIDQGVHSFVWSVVFFLYMWLGSLAIGVSGGIALARSRGGGDLPLRAHARRNLVRFRRRRSDAGTSAPIRVGLVAQRGDESVGEVAPIAFEASERWFGVPSSPASALTSSRIRCEAAGATCVSTAALMERASAPDDEPSIPGGSEPAFSVRGPMLSLWRHPDGACPGAARCKRRGWIST